MTAKRRQKQQEEKDLPDDEELGGTGWKRYFGESREIRRSVAALFMFAVSVFIVLAFFGQAGAAGEYADRFLGVAFGWGKWVFPLLLFAMVRFLLQRNARLYYVSIASAVISFIAILGMLHLVFDIEDMRELARDGAGGGYAGYVIAASMVSMFGLVASAIFLSVFVFSGLLIAFGISLFPIMERLHTVSLRTLLHKRKAKNNDEADAEDISLSDDRFDEAEEETDNFDESERQTSLFDSNAKKNDSDIIGKVRFDSDERTHTIPSSVNNSADIAEDELEEDGEEEIDTREREAIPEKKRKKSKKVKWRRFPVHELLVKSKNKANAGDTEEKKERIVQTFAEFGVNVEPDIQRIGPSVTQFRFRPAPGVRMEKIATLSSNLAYALAARSIRVEAPIPGESLIGIEVPNDEVAGVCLREALESRKFREKMRSNPLPIALGKNIAGEFECESISSMPHLLVAGSTGSGKSVCVHSMLLSLLFAHSPDELNLILVDPKRVEMMLYEGVPHLKTPVIVDMKKVIASLRWAVDEMELRYDILGKYRERDIMSFNDRAKRGEFLDDEGEEMEPMPFVVIVIEEFADLMMSHRKDVEAIIVRLTQKARAVGIHLILSTQRPSVDVITGSIKNNIVTRIALKVPTQIDSRTILDRPGAEKLLGRGDMLFMTASDPHPRRIQGVGVSTEEVRGVVSYLQEHYGVGEVEEDADGEESDPFEEERKVTTGGIDFAAYEQDAEHDELYDAAKEMVMTSGEASASFLQRRLSVGYNRASKLLDAMEEEGIVGPKNGAKRREVLAGIAVSGGFRDSSEDIAEE
jgi:S-DNA-T family DNA segregation ATPase FtsK/SpoIIIE